MTDRPTASAKRIVSFGPFRLNSAQQLLLEGDAPVRLGARALEILVALVERAGELVSKGELMARVWPNTTVDESNLKVHVAGLRRALGDGQPGRRYLANVPGRGYRFVAPVQFADFDQPPTPQAPATPLGHNLPVSRTRAVGRAEVIQNLLDQVKARRFITIVGPGGIGKTTVALAVAEALLPAYMDGVRYLDLSPVEDTQFVAGALGTTLGIALNANAAIAQLTEFLHDKNMLILLDCCDRMINAAAALAEQLLANLPGIAILATSREPLRAEGERVYRLNPLQIPPVTSSFTAEDALAFPAVQLFVERAAAIRDGFAMSDAEAPAIAHICRKLGGIPLAIELAAARVDAFGVAQLSDLLEDRLRILRKGKRTAQPRHQSLEAALDWSFDVLPENERALLCRLAVFGGEFTLDSAIAVAADGNTDAVEGIADLVAKSLISADVGATDVRYRLLDTTRAYAKQKLVDRGEYDIYAGHHARHALEWARRAEAAWTVWASPDWLEEYRTWLDDIRGALRWAFSPTGDAIAGIALSIAAIPLWLEVVPTDESRAHLERALASLTAQPAHDERDELKLLSALCLIMPNTIGITPVDDAPWTQALVLSKKLGDPESERQALLNWANYCCRTGRLFDGAKLAETSLVVPHASISPHLSNYGHLALSHAAFFSGDLSVALHHVGTVLNQPALQPERALTSQRMFARNFLANILWLRGSPDQAVECANAALNEALSLDNPSALSNSLAAASGPIALYAGNLAEAERLSDMLSRASVLGGLQMYEAVARCMKGMILLARGHEGGLTVLGGALDWLRAARYAEHFTFYLSAFAQGLASAGRMAEAHTAIDEALERSERHGERWCMAELLRAKGEVLRLEATQEARDAAEECFRQALEWARRQDAVSWELRAAMGLASLWQESGKTGAAYDLLHPVYSRFNEGFKTQDLKSARAMIAQLGVNATSVLYLNDRNSSSR